MTMESGAEKNGTWEEVFRVRSCEADSMKCATLESLCLYFQEAAWNHAEALGVGFGHLRGQGRLWVLSRLAVEVERPAQWGETIKALTWPRGVESIYAMRDFEILDAQEHRIAAGASAWLVLNAESRRPQRLDKILSHIQGLPERQAVGRSPEKLPDSTLPAEGAHFRVRYSDIDANGHVNNSRYIRWITNSYPAHFHRAYRPLRLEINYIGETLEGDTISVRTLENAPGDYSHEVVKAGHSESVCRARLIWQPFQE